MMKEKKFCIRIGKESMRQITFSQLSDIQKLITDFLKKEKDIPLAGEIELSKIQPDPSILIAKDVCSELSGQKTEAEYSIHIHHDSITNLTAEELMCLYLSLQSFLLHSEKLQTKTIPSCKKDKNSIRRQREVKLMEEQGEAQPPLFSVQGSPFISKRTWLSDKKQYPESEYSLYTANGNIWSISRQELLALKKQMEAFFTQHPHLCVHIKNT